MFTFNLVRSLARMVGAMFASGTLANTTPVVIAMAGAPIPSMVFLKSTAGGRLIEWSEDGGLTYWNAIYDYTNASKLTFIVNAPITHIRVTGQNTDTYGVC